MSEPRPLVLQVTHALGAGGAEQLVAELVARLPARGFRSAAVTVLGGGPLESRFRDEQLSVNILKREGFLGWKTIRNLVRLFRAEKPTVVHTHLFLADTWGRIAAKIAGVPVVISTEHNVNVSYSWFHHFVNRVLSVITDAIIAVSIEVKRALMRDEGIKEKKIRVVLNGIDLARVMPRGSRPFHDVPRLLCVGRLYPQKNYHTLFKALALVKRPWRLSIVGTGPLDKELRNLAERLGISPRIVWLGYRDDGPELLADADLFCFPSSYEGLGLAAIEAGAAGVPIIASDLPALHEVFQTDDVRFVSSSDVPSWTEALREIMDDPITAVLRATRAVPRVTSLVSIDRMVDEYATIYKKSIKSQVSNLKQLKFDA